MASDRLTDSLERHWLTGASLGRGTWGRTRLVRDANGRDAVLKEPLLEADFPADAPIPDDLVAGCRAIAREQIEQLQQLHRPCPPRLEATVDLGDGRTALLIPRYDTLERRLEAGLPLAEVVRLVHQVCAVLAETGWVHGNLRPSNIWFDERDEVVLADASTPTLGALQARLAELAHTSEWLPPEARHRARGEPSRMGPSWDTWALCQVIHAAIHADPAGADALRLAPGGLDKVSLAQVKETAADRLAAERSNARFRARVIDRMGALLGRGLSPDHDPSPPYRFSTARELAERLAELLALLRPRVVEVGKVLLPSHAADGVFAPRAGQPSAASFTVTVACTPGITDHDDLVCGIQLSDLDRPDVRRPVEDAEIAINHHASGRLRFQVSLGALTPGRYRIRVAFAVKDSGDEPLVTSGEFEVRPPPGYVPPPREPAPPAAIAFQPRTKSTADDGSPLFPRPVAPPDDPEDTPPAPSRIAPQVRATPPPPPAPTPAPPPRHLPDEAPPPASLRPAPPPAYEPHPPAAMAPISLRDDPTDGLDTEELLSEEPTPSYASPDRRGTPPFGGWPDARSRHDPLRADSPTVPEDREIDLPGTSGDDLRPIAPPPRPGLPGPLAAMVELVRKDPYVAAGSAVAGSLILVLVTTALLENC